MTSAGRRLVGALALGTFLAGLPVAGGFHPGGLEIGLSKAFAKDGNSGKGGDDKGGGKSSSGGKGGDDKGGGKGSSDNKGSSGGKGGGGKGGGSGKGGGDDNGDRGGSGRGGGDDSGGGDGGGGRGRGGDDARGDDSGGRGRGGDDRGGDDRGGQGAVRGATGGGGLSVVKVERSASGVEITYSNGVREEIENGRFEQKDAAGRTVIERPATGSDVARLDGNARRSRIVVPTGSGAPRVEASATAIEVSYPTGWREELEGGRYELKDPNNNTVVERAATSADVRRLRALAAR